MCQDAATLLWRKNNKCFLQIVLASVYSDITKPAIPKALENITSFCFGRGLSCIVGIDTTPMPIVLCEATKEIM
jgi:hypothetical protein